MTYYARKSSAHEDGTETFQTAGDQRNEATVAEEVAVAWRCNVKPFGMLCPIDWFAERHGRLVGIIEFKTRTHDRGRFPTVFLNVRKWLALSLGEVGLGVRATFIVKFNDGIFWVPLREIDASRHIIGGCARVVKSHTDIEPVIEIPVGTLRVLSNANAEKAA